MTSIIAGKFEHRYEELTAIIGEKRNNQERKNLPSMLFRPLAA
jgi:hypothetical protein